MSPISDVAIIGAGPYGLSLAEHLRHRGVSFRIFGSPMRFWRDMPQGVALKSFDFATNIYTPRRRFSFVEYCKERGFSSRQPVDMSVFTEYGLWAQAELVPEVEDVEVVRLARSTKGFEIELSTGESATTRCVVVAVGLRYFERVPDFYRGLPTELASHTSAHRDYASFRGKDVTVVGAGQSALEAAALLNQHGASVRMIVRGQGMWFATEMAERRSLRDRLLYPQTVLGPGNVNWALEHLPMLIHYAPERRRVRFTRRHLGPFGTFWLRDKIEDQFPVHLGTTVSAARAEGAGLVLKLRSSRGVEEIRTDHVIAGTGYEIDVDRVPFLDADLAWKIRRVERAPRLDRNFQSSVTGLYFVGPAAAFSFGPLMRFVCGAAFVAPHVAGHIRRATAGPVRAGPQDARRSAERTAIS